ncbi:MAG TPA: Ig-like domain-containing protein [Gemmatimonadales bacterium]|nr:Ig-like domain-containing protein [Gemmatimonadales bacterium]
MLTSQLASFRGPTRKGLAAVATAVLLACGESSGPGPTVGRVVVTGRALLYLGDSSRFTATVLSTTGDTLRNQQVTWSSSDSTVATVSAVGMVKAVAVGQATIRAGVSGSLGTASLAVELVPVSTIVVLPALDSLFVDDSLQLTATPRDSAGGALSGRALVWASSDTARATITATGLVHALAPGSFAITVTSEAKVGGAFLSALQRVAELVLPDTAVLRRYQLARLIPDLRGSNGARLAGRQTTWTTLDPAIVLVDASGLITPQQLGYGRLTAASSGFADTAVIEVVPESVVGMSWSVVGDLRLYVGRPDSMQVVPLDSAGRPVDGAVVSWMSSDTTVARVVPDPADSRTGRISTVGRGPVFIFASSGAGKDSAYQEAEFPITTWRFAPDSLLVPVREGRFLVAAGSDSLGRVLAVARGITPNILDTGIVAASGGSGFWSLSGLRPGRARVTGIVYDLYPVQDTAIVIVPDSGRERLFWELETATVPNYRPVSMRIYFTDSAGGALPPGHTIIITSTDTSVLTLEDTVYSGVLHDTLITAQAHGPGSARLVASGDSAFASFAVVVNEVRPFQITISPPTVLAAEGYTLQLGATVLGTDLSAYSYPIQWSSSDTGVIKVSATGVVDAVGGGAATVTARVGSITGSVPVLVQSLTGPGLSSTNPSPFVPGGTATIFGSGFEPTPAGNVVTLDGVPVSVTAASDTLLTLLVPGPDAFACDSPHYARLVVSSAGRYSFTVVPFAPAPLVTIGSNGPLRLSAKEARCFNLAQPANAGLLFSVVNTTPTSEATFDFEMRASVTSAATGSSAALLETAPPEMPTGDPVMGIDRDSLRSAAQLHRRLLEGSRALSLRAGSPVPLLQAARLQRPQLSVVARIGDLVAVRVPRIDYPDFCARYSTIVARLVYKGAHALVFEDTLAPLRRTMDTDFQAVGQEFDGAMWNVLQANFGDPLALDSLLDNDGRIAMVFTPAVNSFGVGGFVVSCDFYPEAAAPSSNTGEIFYAQVPTVAGTGFQGYTKDVWRWLIRTVIMHESKHLTAFAERLARGAPLEDTWLEEATAVGAEEVWARTIYGTAWKGNAIYAQTLYCDVRPTFPQCAGRPYSMFNAFAFLYDYAVGHEHRTPLGPLTSDDATFYGSGWSLLRWTIDQYAVSESAFLKALTQEPVLLGVDNLVEKAGHSFPEVASDWALALRVDGSPQANTPGFPSWKLSDIFAGMHQDFPNDFTTTQPVAQRDLIFGDRAGPLPGGTFVLYHQIAGPLTQIIQLRGLDGGQAPAALRLEVFREP